MSATPFDPLNMKNIAESIHGAIMSDPAVPLKDLKKFSGPGIYALYYKGTFPSYAELSAANDAEATFPLYVGKAIPAGGRKGASTGEAMTNTALYKRLNEHRSSIVSAENLDIDHFSARWLVLDPVWISLGETLMIGRYAPVWNLIAEGFGNHAPGSGRAAGKIPLWDVLHPGRGWSLDLASRTQLAANIMQDVEEHIRARLR